MSTSSRSLELFRLGNEFQYLSVTVLGRHSPGVLPLHDTLRAKIIIQTEIGTLRLETSIAPSDVDDWASVIDALAADEPSRGSDTAAPGSKSARATEADSGTRSSLTRASPV